MSEEAALEIRSRLERALRRKLYEVVWQNLLGHGFVMDYLNGTLEEDPKEAWRRLKEAAEERMQLIETGMSEARGEYSRNPDPPPSKRNEDEQVLTAFLDLSLFVGSKSTAML
jgi:hypothetical protein